VTVTASTPTRPAVARADRSFPWYIGAALAVAVSSGFVLAILLPLAVVLDWRWGVRWRALVQVHGHLQIGGWLGLFVIGMMFRLLPRFAGRPLQFAWVTWPALALLLLGTLGRGVAQPWLGLPGMRVLLDFSVVAELIGTLLVAVSIGATTMPALRTFAPAPLFLVGVTGLVVQAALGAVWLPAMDGAVPALPPARDEALLSLQFYAFLLPVVFGVSLRALPSFFARPAPTFRWMWAVAALLAAGAALYAGARLLVAGPAGLRLEQMGGVLIAAAIAGVVLQTGVWRPAERLRPSARHAALLIRTAYAWLAVAALGLAWVSLAGLLGGRIVRASEVDAIRHIFAVGVFSTLIIGMAQLVLPWLAMRRQRPNAARVETWTLWLLLTAATVLRVAGALLSSADAARWWLMAAGGLLAIIAVAYFAVTVLRAARLRPEIVVHEAVRR
jgi:uncharacterized protein involved in response to NO